MVSSLLSDVFLFALILFADFIARSLSFVAGSALRSVSFYYSIALSLGSTKLWTSNMELSAVKLNCSTDQGVCFWGFF